MRNFTISDNVVDFKTILIQYDFFYFLRVRHFNDESLNKYKVEMRGFQFENNEFYSPLL